jgi:tellurite resistance protein
MQIDSPTVRRLRDMLLERAGLSARQVADHARPPLADDSPEVQALMTRVGPICEALYLVMTTDGDSDARELDAIRGALVTLTAGAITQHAIESMLGRYAAAAAQQGPQERLIQVASKLSADREDAEAALALAAAVAVADGAVASSEEGMLVDLSEWLGISRARAAVILDTSE